MPTDIPAPNNAGPSVGHQQRLWNYEVHEDHHVMMCIGNRINLHLFLTILTMFFWDDQIMILSNSLNSVEFKLPFTWALATCTWGLLCGSVALRYTWNLLTFFSPPVLGGGTVHGLCHSPSYVWLRILHFVNEIHLFCSKTIKWGIMTQFNQGNDFLFEWLDLDWKFCTAVLIRGMKKCHSWVDLVTWDLEHDVRLVFHGLTLL